MAAAKELAAKNGGEVVIKIQAWTTGRAGIGGVAFAETPEEVRGHAERMPAMRVGQFPVEKVLVEEKIAIEREFFLSFAIDDAARGNSALSFALGDAIKSRCKGERRSSRLSEHLSAGTGAHWRRFAPTILPPTSSRPSWSDPASTPH